MSEQDIDIGIKLVIGILLTIAVAFVVAVSV